MLCHAIDPNDVYEKAGTYGYDPTPLLDEMRAHADVVIGRARERLAGAEPITTIVEERASWAICGEAERREADLIVIGSHGRRGLQRMFLGSVAEDVVRHGPVPVLVVRTV